MGTINSIDQYLTHLVDINHVTLSRGLKTITSTETDVPAFIAEKYEIMRSGSGDYIGTAKTSHGMTGTTYVMFKPDQVFGPNDEIVINGVVHVNQGIKKVWDRKSVRFLQVYI